MHGQITGKKIKSSQIERDVLYLVSWIDSLADVASAEFGYDGLGRNTFRAAKASADITVAKYPFSTTAEFEAWLGGIVNAVKKRGVHAQRSSEKR
jgi:hypothetical protein